MESTLRKVVWYVAVTALVEYGYRRGVTIRAAPYDFRYAPHSQPSYFTELRHLVENTWAINGRRKVVLLAHSMGGLFSAYFLSRQTGAWKERYIEAVITVNTPWAGLSLYSLYSMKNIVPALALKTPMPCNMIKSNICLGPPGIPVL